MKALKENALNTGHIQGNTLSKFQASNCSVMNEKTPVTNPEIDLLKEAARRHKVASQFFTERYREQRGVIDYYRQRIRELKHDSRQLWELALEEAHMERLATERLQALGALPSPTLEHKAKWAQLRALHTATLAPKTTHFNDFLAQLAQPAH